MKTMAISEFKTHCLQVLGRVARTKETVVVTKRGKPLVEVVPVPSSRRIARGRQIVGNAGVREGYRLSIGRIDMVTKRLIRQSLVFFLVLALGATAAMAQIALAI